MVLVIGQTCSSMMDLSRDAVTFEDNEVMTFIQEFKGFGNQGEFTVKNLHMVQMFLGWFQYFKTQ